MRFTRSKKVAELPLRKPTTPVTDLAREDWRNYFQLAYDPGLIGLHAAALSMRYSVLNAGRERFEHADASSPCTEPRSRNRRYSLSMHGAHSVWPRLLMITTTRF